MKRFTLLPLVAALAISSCATTTQQTQEPTRPSYEIVTVTPIPSPIESESPELIREPKLPANRPSNWGIERKVNGDDRFVISRSLEESEYMWLTCKIDGDGVAGLSIGVVQPDEIGYRGDDAILVFMVDGREVIFGPGVMVNSRNAGIRSFDPRQNYMIDATERKLLTDRWINDEGRVAQYEVIEQMLVGDFIIAEIQLPGIKRDVNVDLKGFPQAAHEVITACNAEL